MEDRRENYDAAQRGLDSISSPNSNILQPSGNFKIWILSEMGSRLCVLGTSFSPKSYHLIAIFSLPFARFPNSTAGT